MKLNMQRKHSEHTNLRLSNWW